MAGQAFDRRAEQPGELPRLDPVLGLLDPAFRRVRPSATRAEPGGVHHRAGIGHRDAALLPHAGRPRTVDQDAEQPGLQRGPALEPVQAAEHRQPGVLDDLLGHRRAGHERQREPEHGTVVAFHERDEGPFVTRPQAAEQLRVWFHRWQSTAKRVRKGGAPYDNASKDNASKDSAAKLKGRLRSAHISSPQPALPPAQSATMPSPPAAPATVTDPISVSEPPTPTAYSSTM